MRRAVCTVRNNHLIKRPSFSQLCKRQKNMCRLTCHVLDPPLQLEFPVVDTLKKWREKIEDNNRPFLKNVQC